MQQLKFASLENNSLKLVKLFSNYKNYIQPFREYTEAHGYAVNEDFGGHGIAHEMHMAPMIYHHKSKHYTKEVMKPNMAFTIEPILMMNNHY